MDNYYEILEVHPSASEEEIRQAYKILIQVWHPDRFEGKPVLKTKAERKSKEIQGLRELVWVVSSMFRRSATCTSVS